MLSLYVDSLMAATGETRVRIASLYGAATLGAALCLPLVGRAADRLSGSRFLGLTVASLAGAMVLLANARSAATLVLAFFALRLLGQGAIGLGTLTTTVRWFSRRRARALSIVGLGYALGEMTFPALVLGMTAGVGWHGSLLALAATYAAIFAPLIAWGIRMRPHAVPDGDARHPETTEGGSMTTERSFTASEAVKRPVFWIALASAAFMPMIMTGLIFHQVALFGSFGWSASLVAPAFLAYAISGVVTTLAAGFALERVQPRWGFVASACLAIIALAVGQAGLPAAMGAIVYGALLGSGGGVANATNSVLWPAFFGIESLGAIKGIVNGVRNGATAVGPILVAALLAASSPGVVEVTLIGLLLVMAAMSLLLECPGASRSRLQFLTRWPARRSTRIAA